MTWALNRVEKRAITSKDSPPTGWIAVYVTCIERGFAFKDLTRRAEWYHMPEGATLEQLLVQLFGVKFTRVLFEDDDVWLVHPDKPSIPSPVRTTLLSEGDVVNVRVKASEIGCINRGERSYVMGSQRSERSQDSRH